MRLHAKKLLLVFLGGGLGATARYVLSGFVYEKLGSGFPYGTLAVNLTGCFLIGILMSVFEGRFLVNPTLRVFLTIGILGGFTTFSTFSYETIALLSERQILAATGNILFSLLFSLLFCLIGTWLGMQVGKLL